MRIDKELFKAASGEKIKGYEIIEDGVDEKGRYKLIKTPTGEEEKVYQLKEEKTRDYFQDKYNKLHNFRRALDEIVFYFNQKEEDYIILAVLDEDDLYEEPFLLKDSFIIRSKMLESDIYIDEHKGFVKINSNTLDTLIDKNIIPEALKKIIMFNKKNVGFYL